MDKKILVCAYFAKNLGDDLFLKILFDRYPNVKWDLLTANRHYLNVFKDYKNVDIIYSYRELRIGKLKFNLFFELNEKILHFKKYDALVHIGGSIFMQSAAWEMKFSEREYLVNAFKKFNKKTFIMGSNFGPFQSEEFVYKYKRLFTHYDDICFRDNYSYSIFKDLLNVRKAPDIVFNLKVNGPHKQEKSVGFSVINLRNRDGLKEYYNQYNKKIIEMARNYQNAGYRIKLFSFCENERDLEIANLIRDNLINNINLKSVRVINYKGNINDFLMEFAACEVIVGTRFHSIILALLFNQSMLPLVYNEKIYHVLEDLKLEKNTCHIKDIEKLNVANMVGMTANNRLKNRELISKAHEQFYKLDLELSEYQ